MEKRIFITGGASGLGKAIALLFAKKSWCVCIGDINAELGEATLGELKQYTDKACYLHCDVRQLSDIENVRDHLQAEWNGVDVVVNNAGVAGNAASIENVSIDDWQWVIDINLIGIVKVYKVFSSLLKAQKSGHFVNISSAAGLMNAPRMSNYNATKAAVISISETTRFELAPFNVGVSVVCPSFFPTNLARSIRSESDSTKQWVEKAMSRSGVSAEKVAEYVYRGFTDNTFWVLPHKAERRMWLLKRWMPEFFFRQMLKKTRSLFNKT